MSNGKTQFTLGTISTQIESLHEDVRDIKGDNKDRDKRLRSLENKWYWYIGTLGFGVSLPWIVNAISL